MSSKKIENAILPLRIKAFPERVDVGLLGREKPVIGSLFVGKDSIPWWREREPDGGKESVYSGNTGITASKY